MKNVTRFGTTCICENPDCIFIATNGDATNMTDFQEWSRVGCMVAAIFGSTQKELIVDEKPSTFFIELLHK